jgi:hypothetical protein
MAKKQKNPTETFDIPGSFQKANVRSDIFSQRAEIAKVDGKVVLFRDADSYSGALKLAKVSVIPGDEVFYRATTFWQGGTNRKYAESHMHPYSRLEELHVPLGKDIVRVNVPVHPSRR